MSAELLLSNNGIHFGPGDTLTISIGINQTETLPMPVDIYFAVVPPASDSALFVSGEPGDITITPGAIGAPETWTPLARSFQLNEGLDTGLVPFVTSPLGEGILTGDYMIAFATTNAGTFDVVDSKFATIRVLENSIKANLGGFSGTWSNNTFNVSGPVSLTLDEVSAGVLEGTLDMGGFVSWRSQSGTETRQVELADLTGLIEFEVEDELIDGTYSVTYTPQGEITIAIDDIGYLDYFSFSATGAREGDTVNLDYQVNTSIGVLANGTVSGEADNN